MVQILSEHEFQRVDDQNWHLALKSDKPGEVYYKMRAEIEEAMAPQEVDQTLTPEQTTWYRES